MSYSLKSVSLRVDYSAEGTHKVQELWRDIASGRLPLLLSQNGRYVADMTAIAVVNNYDIHGKFSADMTIEMVDDAFLQQLNKSAEEGKFVKYDFVDAEGLSCERGAWLQVMSDAENKVIHRAYESDYDYIVAPQFSADGRKHCLLFISVL